MRFSAMSGPGKQCGSEMRLLFGSDGFQVSPMKTAKVKRELTLMMPSSAVMWMLVPNRVWLFWSIDCPGNVGTGNEVCV